MKGNGGGDGGRLRNWYSGSVDKTIELDDVGVPPIGSKGKSKDGNKKGRCWHTGYQDAEREMEDTNATRKDRQAHESLIGGT